MEVSAPEAAVLTYSSHTQESDGTARGRGSRGDGALGCAGLPVGTDGKQGHPRQWGASAECSLDFPPEFRVCRGPFTVSPRSLQTLSQPLLPGGLGREHLTENTFLVSAWYSSPLLLGECMRAFLACVLDVLVHTTEEMGLYFLLSCRGSGAVNPSRR